MFSVCCPLAFPLDAVTAVFEPLWNRPGTGTDSVLAPAGWQQQQHPSPRLQLLWLCKHPGFQTGLPFAGGPAVSDRRHRGALAKRNLPGTTSSSRLCFPWLRALRNATGGLWSSAGILVGALCQYSQSCESHRLALQCPEEQPPALASLAKVPVWLGWGSGRGSGRLSP